MQDFLIPVYNVALEFKLLRTIPIKDNSKMAKLLEWVLCSKEIKCWLEDSNMAYRKIEVYR